ncbi:hypothetical protein [Streptomyces sp. SM11]|uniref:hypothetical protein n=1 Tax=Streptomyces sp. SM11 TaxID=565557 RepID=UPI0015E19056|nr:hypothetical protein [Streptomyces sp. SM11]
MGAVKGHLLFARCALSSWSPFVSELFQEHAMADLAFVVTTVAIFALVSLIAKGVAKL